MSKYFLAGVANAEIFDGENNLFATAKALTDSSITIGVNSEEVRGGEGAALRGKYFHSSSFGLRMTSAMFEMEYIAANVGAKIVTGGDALVYKDVKSDVNGKITLPTTAVPLTGNTVYAYASVKGADKFDTYEVSSGNTIVVSGSSADYCVKYFENNISARAIKINTNFVPDTLYVVLTASLFAGDAKAGSGTKVGSVVIKVPRFQLNGSQEISMTMTGASNTAFEGSALAVEEDGCDGKAYYAEILEILFNARWYDNVRSIQIEDSDVTVKAGAVNVGLDVYAIYANALPKKISNDIISAGEGSVEVEERSKLVFSKVGDTKTLSIDSGTGDISGTATQGTYTFRVAAMKGETPLGLDATMLLTVTA
nr:MAG TPA: structural protein [Bacteriophage sp.]